MSGDSWEYVMGNYSDTTKNSGFDATWFKDDTKYYDKYKVESIELCKDEECKGHALGETAGWYGDSAGFVNSSYPWFGRGGNWGTGAGAGVFDFGVSGGSSIDYYSFRVVIAPSV